MDLQDAQQRSAGHPWYHRTMKVFVGCCLALIGLYVAAYTYVQTSFEGNAEFPVDCAIVFGAAVYRGSYPGPAIVRRVAAAADLYRTDKVNRLILSGGRGEGNAQSEAFVMRREALKQGVDMRDIVIEEQSRSTMENLRYTRNLTSDCSSVVAISDQYHLGRIRLLALRQGWFDLQIYPAQNRELMTGAERWSFQREVFGVLYYGLFMDYILQLNPDDESDEAETTDAGEL